MPRRNRGHGESMLFGAGIRWVPIAVLLAPVLVLVVTAIRNSAELASATTRFNLWQLLANTVSVAAVAAVIAAIIGLPLGLMLGECRVLGRRFVLMLLALALVLPAELHAMAWFGWFGSGSAAATAWQFELLERVLRVVLHQLSAQVAQTGQVSYWAKVLAAGWVHGLLGSAIVALTIQLGLRAIADEVRDAASLDASPLRALRHVLLPQTRWALASGVLLAVLLSVTEIAVVDLIQLWTLADAIYVAFQLDGQLYGAAALSLPLAVLLAAIGSVTLYSLRTERLYGPEQTIPTIHRRRRSMFGGAVVGIVATLVCWTVALALVAIPLATLLVRAAGVAPDGPLIGLLIQSRSVVVNELAVSLFLATAAAAVAVAVACPWGWSATRPERSRVPSNSLRLAMAVGALAPPLIGLAVANFALAVSVDLYDSYVPAVWALAIRCLPPALVLLPWATSRLPAELFAAAELDGAGAFQLIRWIWLPLCLPVLAAAFVLAVAVAAADVGTAVVCVPPGIPPLTVRLFHLLHYGFDDYVAGLALWLALAVLAIGGVAIGLLGRLSRRSEGGCLR